MKSSVLFYPFQPRAKYETNMKFYDKQRCEELGIHDRAQEHFKRETSDKSHSPNNH